MRGWWGTRGGVDKEPLQPRPGHDEGPAAELFLQRVPLPARPRAPPHLPRKVPVGEGPVKRR